MPLTTPSRAMFTGFGDAADKTVGTDPDELPTNADIHDPYSPVFADQSTAEAGTVDDEHMSPLGVAQAIAARDLGLGLWRGGSLDLSSGTGGLITDLGEISDADLIEIWLAGVTASGTDHLLIQLGDSGGLEATGYTSASGHGTTGGQFVISTSGLVAYSGGSGVWTGCMQLRRITGNQWAASHSLQVSATGTIAAGGGQKTLSAALDRIGIGFTGANTFSAGTVQVFAGKTGS